MEDQHTTANFSPVQEPFQPGEEIIAPPETEGAETETGQGRGGLSLLREIVETIVLTLVIFMIINALTGRFRIEGPSMKPTLHEGQYLLINKVVYKLHPPRRGDIIVFHHPQDSTRDLIKRVVGLPGEEIEACNKQVTIDGMPLKEPYLVHLGGRCSGRIELGADEVFVLGDNRPNSDDSRSWGGLQQSLIVGKAWIAYWPPGDWGGVPHYSYSGSATAQRQRTGAGDD